jgi:oligopeptide/dipeptide ABC transporter ATP-binding protein
MSASSGRAQVEPTTTRTNQERRRLVPSLRRDRLAIVSLVWLLLVALMAIFRWTPYSPQAVDLPSRLLAPMSLHGGALHVLGTDEIGRDYLSQLIVGARASIMFGFIGATIATGFALVVGSIAGYAGGRSDAAISRLIDAQLSFPTLLLALLLLISVGPSVGAVIVVLAVGSWPEIARLVRSLALEIRKKAYIESATALDAGTPHIIRRHVVPNLLAPVLVYGTIMIAVLMLSSAGLDFLGLGIQPPDTSWGLLIATGRNNIQRAWWLITLPGIAIFLTVLAVNLVALWLRRVNDPSDSISRAQAAGALVAPAPLELGPSDDPSIAADAEVEHPGELVDNIPEPPPVASTETGLDVGYPADRVGKSLESAKAGGPAPILVVDRLSVDYFGRSSVAHAVRGVSWELYPGEVLAIVGESGSGKSVTAKTIMGILEQPQGRVTGGRVLLKGRDLLSLSRKEGRAVYGRVVTMVQQDAVAALDPVTTIGAHLEEAIRAHNSKLTRREIRARALDLLDQVGIPDPATRFGQFPFQFSGGMCQRVLVAMAVANDPEILVADEPTTALDVSIQAQIMDLLMELQAAYRMSMVLITHDLGLVAERADRIVVMYGGMVMETGTIADIIERPGNPYTQALLRARPDITAGRSRLAVVPGLPPSASRLPSGCPFNPRCPLAVDLCRSDLPRAIELAPGHESTCHRAWEAYQA